MTRTVIFLCLAVCISAKILGPAGPNMSNTIKEKSFWESVVDFLTKFNSSSLKSVGTIPQTKSTEDFRKIKIKNDHHPYMTTIYDEVSGKKHQKWTAMETDGGATIRGIEPFKVTNNQHSPPASVILEFNIETIDSLDDMKHVELCLSSAFVETNTSRIPMDDGTFQVELLLPKVYQAPSKMNLPSYQQQGHIFLELTSAIRGWWNRQFFKSHHSLSLRISREDGSAFRIIRPLIIFYYKASAPERAKDQALFEAAQEALLRKARDVHMPPKLNWAYGERKAPISTKHSRHNPAPCTLHNKEVSLKDLRWDHLFIAPSKFDMNYCSGSCNGALADPVRNNVTMHTRARALLIIHLPLSDTEDIPPPYCVPSKLKDIDSMYKDNQDIVLKKWEKIVAYECGCS